MRFQRYGRLSLILAIILVVTFIMMYLFSSSVQNEDPDETRIVMARPIWEKRKLQQPDDDQYYRENENNVYISQGDGAAVLKLPNQQSMTVIDDWEREQNHHDGRKKEVDRTREDKFGADDKEFVRQKTEQKSEPGNNSTKGWNEASLTARLNKLAKEMNILLSDPKGSESNKKENSVVSVRALTTSKYQGTATSVHSTQYTEKIAILTPIANAEKRLDRFAKLIKSLSYPHNLISVSFGEDSSGDGTYEKVKVVADRMKHEFRRVDFFHFNESLYLKQDWSEIHRKSIQLKRRTHLAKSRNNLIFEGIKDEDWALWIDSDVTELPIDLIQKLLAAKKDIIVPSCMLKNDKGEVHLYDRNTWRETKSSVEFQKHKSPDYLMLEGYNSMSDRLFLPDLKSDGDVVRIDGVGGCVLMIKAIHHKQGLIFPPFIFDHHIETEGLAKMAKAMNISMWGMPNLEVYH